MKKIFVLVLFALNQSAIQASNPHSPALQVISALWMTLAGQKELVITCQTPKTPDSLSKMSFAQRNNRWTSMIVGLLGDKEEPLYENPEMGPMCLKPDRGINIHGHTVFTFRPIDQSLIR